MHECEKEVGSHTTNESSNKNAVLSGRLYAEEIDDHWQKTPSLQGKGNKSQVISQRLQPTSFPCRSPEVKAANRSQQSTLLLTY